MSKELQQQHVMTFEELKQSDQNGVEFWFGRDLQGPLDYDSWRSFERVIIKAQTACKNSGQMIEDHFVQVDKMVPIGSGAARNILDYKLSRYACYLIVQNADAAKPVIAHGQSYFAVQTRRQELQDNDSFRSMSEDQKRLMLRNELKEHNKNLVATAHRAGVESNLDFAIFQDHGYKGLYGGLGAKEIHTHKGLKKSHKILDHMGSTELAANLFRATQTEEKLRRDEVQGKKQANSTHYQVGRKVRQTIEELGGTMPEDLPVPDQSIQQLERSQKKRGIASKSRGSK
ncbi:MAG: DNA damage-inducible protein D [Magnetococcales bacterium]|nr:DNA damage-inducible protein D [Magnetococcales bacterium]